MQRVIADRWENDMKRWKSICDYVAAAVADRILTGLSGMLR